MILIPEIDKDGLHRHVPCRSIFLMNIDGKPFNSIPSDRIWALDNYEQVDSITGVKSWLVSEKPFYILSGLK